MLCVVLSGQDFRPVEGDTDSVVREEVTLCWQVCHSAEIRLQI